MPYLLLNHMCRDAELSKFYRERAEALARGERPPALPPEFTKGKNGPEYIPYKILKKAMDC